MIEVKKISPKDKEAKKLIDELDDYLKCLYPAESNYLDSVEELSKDNVHFVGAFENENIVGCGSVKIMDQDYGEIKRVYVPPKYRGKGISKIIMNSLENFLMNSHIKVVRLETGIHQKEAIGLYTKRGYKRTAPFGTYREDPLSIFMEKNLT